MTFKIIRLTVGKGKTVGDEKAEKWTREYFELEAELQDEREVELAKGSMETLIDTWLKGETIGSAKDPTKLPYRIDVIPWQDRQNEKGLFQICSDESNPDFKALRGFILQHAGGKISTKDSQGVSWFVWAFDDQKTVGRKKSQFKQKG